MEQNSKLMVKNEKFHDTVKNTKAHFRSGTDSGLEIACLVSGFTLLAEHSVNEEPITACGNGIRPDHVRYKPWFIEEMKKHSIRGRLFALLLPKMNDRWATFEW